MQSNIFPKPFQIILILTCAFAILIFKLIYISHISESEKSTEFTINKPYLIVVSEIAKKEFFEEAIKNSGSELIEKEWKNFEVISPDRKIQLREYELIGDLDFKISKNDKNLGNLVLDFNQKIDLNKKEFKIETELNEQNKNILKCNKLIVLSPDSDRILNKTKVKIKSEIKIKNRIPFFAKKTMDRKVNESNNFDLSSTKDFLIKKTNEM